MKNIISLLLVSVLLLTATSASADYDKGERGHKGGEKHEAFANLDEDIKAALKEAHESMEEEAEALKEGFDRDEASDEEKEAMKAKMEELREAHHAKVVELLEDYPEVLAAMKEKREEMKDRAGKMKGKKG
jgi:FMN phosphatase YigB (HAD superfamily)